MVWIFVSHTLIPDIMVFGGGALRRWLSHEEVPLTNGMNALIKEVPESSLAPLSYEITVKTAISEGAGPPH